jgi:hypothetical protein
MNTSTESEVEMTERELYECLIGVTHSINNKKFEDAANHVVKMIDMLEGIENVFERNERPGVERYIDFLVQTYRKLSRPTLMFRILGYRDLAYEFNKETTEFVIGSLVPWMAVRNVDYTCFMLGGYGGDA